MKILLCLLILIKFLLYYQIYSSSIIDNYQYKFAIKQKNNFQSNLNNFYINNQLPIYAVAFDKSIYMANNNLCRGEIIFYKSNNEGKNFTKISTIIDDSRQHFINQIVVTTNNYIYVSISSNKRCNNTSNSDICGFARGLYKDNKIIFKKVNNFLFSSFTVDKYDEKVIYGVINNDKNNIIYISYNGGINFVPELLLHFNTKIDQLTLSDTGVLYCVSKFVPNLFYKSINKGIDFIIIHSTYIDNNNFIKEPCFVKSFLIISDEIIYENICIRPEKCKEGIHYGYYCGLYKSIDGAKTFKKVNKFVFSQIFNINENTIYAVINDCIRGSILYKLRKNSNKVFTKIDKVINYFDIITNNSNVANNDNEHYLLFNDNWKKLSKLISLRPFDCMFNDFFLYKEKQVIDIKSEYLTAAYLNNEKQTIPKKNLEIPSGKHIFKLILKNKYWAQYMNMFNVPEKTGEIIINLWIKPGIDIDDKKVITYSALNDVQLFNNLIFGNYNINIIQTRKKNINQEYFSELNITINDELINYEKSFYVKGQVDTNANKFIYNEYNKQAIKQNLIINTDGIYMLYLEDFVGNSYTSYLELGEHNWKLTGEILSKNISDIAKKLNVTIKVNDVSKISIIEQWLKKYQEKIDNILNEIIVKKNSGFNDKIRKYVKYIDFVDEVIFDNKILKQQEKFNELELKIFIEKLVHKKFKTKSLNNFIDILVAKLIDKELKIVLKEFVNLNVHVEKKSISNKIILNQCVSWIKKYDGFINANKRKILSIIISNIVRGFDVPEVIVSQIENEVNIQNFLQNITWDTNIVNDYNQFIQFNKLKNFISNMKLLKPEIIKADRIFEQYIEDTKEYLNKMGYKDVKSLLNKYQIPRTKQELENYLNSGKSFKKWLKSEVDKRLYNRLLKLTLLIIIPISFISILGGFLIYWKYSKKHNPT